MKFKEDTYVITIDMVKAGIDLEGADRPYVSYDIPVGEWKKHDHMTDLTLSKFIRELDKKYE